MSNEEDEPSSVVQLYGQLEIDVLRGVIYFHDLKGKTRLRICRLGPIEHTQFIDITHMVGIYCG